MPSRKGREGTLGRFSLSVIFQARAIAEDGRPAIALVVITGFLVALQFLTIIRIKHPLPFNAEAFGRAGAFFPVVGCLLGAAVLALDYVLQPFFLTSLRSVFIVIALAVLSRGLHLDGLADSADGLLGSRERERSLAIMKDSTIGTFGALALIGVLLLKVRALDLLTEENRIQALLLAPTLGRWACVALAYGSVPARKEGLGALFVTQVNTRTYALATLFTAVLVLVFTGLFGFALLAVLGSIVWGWTRYCKLRLGGITGDTLGALGELTETSALLLFLLRETGHG